jgi:PRC-barrel domain
MQISRQVYLFPALVVIWLGQMAASPVPAQTPAGTGPSSANLAESPTSATRRNQLESVLGREVRTRVEEDVGRVVDLLADRQGRVQAAVIEFGGFLGIGTRKIAVEWSALSFVNDGKQPVVIVEMTRNQLRVAPEYKPSEPAVVRRAAD